MHLYSDLSKSNKKPLGPDRKLSEVTSWDLTSMALKEEAKINAQELLVATGILGNGAHPLVMH